MQGVWVQYLVRELRSHMLCGQKLKKKKKGSYRCGDFSGGPVVKAPCFHFRGRGFDP